VSNRVYKGADLLVGLLVVVDLWVPEKGLFKRGKKSIKRQHDFSMSSSRSMRPVSSSRLPAGHFFLFHGRAFVFYLPSPPLLAFSKRRQHSENKKKKKKKTDLVSVAPEEVLGSDVHVRVLGELLPWGLVGLVLPVLGPEAVGVHRRDDDGGDDDAVI